MLKFASVIVNGGKNFRMEASQTFSQRLATLRAIVLNMMRIHNDMDTLLFPAGYFCTKSPSQVKHIANRVSAILNQIEPPFAVAWGVDGWTQAAKHDAHYGPNGYPFFIFAKMPGKSRYIQFQQKSSSAEEGRAAILMKKWGGRVVTIDRGKNALLICGECLSETLLDKVIQAKPKVLLIAGHQNVNLSGGKSTRSWHLRLKHFYRRTKIPVILSEHSRSPMRHSHMWGGKPHSVPTLPTNLPVHCTVKVIEI